MSFADECTRLYTPHGHVAHLRSPAHAIASAVPVLCPQMRPWPGDWLGTGSQAEYDKAARLPACRHCLRRATGEDAYYAEPPQFSRPGAAAGPP